MSRVFAVVVGLALVGGHVWLFLRHPRLRLMAVIGAIPGFQCLWVGATYGRGAVTTVPVVGAAALGVAYYAWYVTRVIRRGRRRPPGSAPPSPGP